MGKKKNAFFKTISSRLASAVDILTFTNDSNMKIQEFLHLCNVLDPGITLKKFKISIHDTHNEAINEN